MPPIVIIKRCGCGRSYGRRRWRMLRLVGIMTDGGSAQASFELRMCICGSSLALRETAPAACKLFRADVPVQPSRPCGDLVAGVPLENKPFRPIE